MKLSILIPVFNGQRTIGPLVENIIRSADAQNGSLEIILIDDGSEDDSAAECERLHGQFSSIVDFAALSKNFGEHNAVMAGLRLCTGSYAVIMDDDNQNPVSEIWKLLDAIQRTGNDVVYSYYDAKKHHRLRNMASWVNDKVANIMLGKPKHLYLSSFKIINRFLINQIKQYDLPFPYIDGLILRSTKRVGRVKTDHQDRTSGKSGYTLKKLFSLWLNTFTNFSVVPLRISALIGFLTCIMGLILGIVTVIERIHSPDTPVGWASLIVTLCVFSGVQLMCFGIAGEYIGRTFLCIGKQPPFIIRKSSRQNDPPG